MFHVIVFAPFGHPDSFKTPFATQAVTTPFLTPGTLPAASATTALARKAAPATKMILFKVSTLPVGFPRIPGAGFRQSVPLRRAFAN
jgi:hypothetical protein